jgi:L-rhamnose mutarotase
MEIYRTGNRLFMIMEVNDEFSFEKKGSNGCGE